MRPVLKFLSFLLLLTGTVTAATPNRYIEPQVWDQVQPYLLPDNHPIKPQLDKIFSNARPTLSIKSMKKAGFENPEPRKFTRLIVTTHPDLKGYVIKTYLDAQRYYKDKPEHVYWILRIQGVQAIQALIEKKQWASTFKVPKKWIYALPAEPSPPSEFQRKNFILVEEDMDLYGTVDNEKIWKSTTITQETLDRVFYVLNKIGLHDCAKPDNIPFTQDGRIAFIDTQTHDQWPVPFKDLTPYLSKDNQAYWKKITKKTR